MARYRYRYKRSILWLGWYIIIGATLHRVSSPSHTSSSASSSSSVIKYADDDQQQAFEVLFDEFLNEKPQDKREPRRSSCPVQFPVPAPNRKPVPLINLRKDYFIVATLPNGPNNQLISFRETMYLAIMLNRTLVLPGFRKHATEG